MAGPLDNKTSITLTKQLTPLVILSSGNGISIIPQPAPLTRLNYFDGKFLRAGDLRAEQLYLRRLVDLSNQAGGPGVAHGYNLALGSGDILHLGPGLAIDPQGRVLLLPEPFSVGIQDLIEKSAQLKSSTSATTPAMMITAGNFADCATVTESQPGTVLESGNLYLITIGFAEALCGQEDVFGKLCEEACVTSTDRPFVVEGVILRAVPLRLQTPLPVSTAVALNQLHLRSRVASSYFEDERQLIASLISGDGLRSQVWCFGAQGASGQEVPLGVIARAGSTTLFLDAWIARRERIDTPAKRYWQWRMAMRPWDVFLAQILQFQCQLSDLFKKQPPDGTDDDPCKDTRTIVREASDTVAQIAEFYRIVTTRFTLQPLPTISTGTTSTGATATTAAGTTTTTTTEAAPSLKGGLPALLDFQKRLQAVSDATLVPSDKFLIDGGIIELPSAGYLPVTPKSIVSINQQVRRLMGKGVDLQFCIVRPDFVAHALEEAQHMERISLIQGLDNPKNKPQVDILVPNGEIIEQKQVSSGTGFEATVNANSLLFVSQASTTLEAGPIPTQMIPFTGAARTERLPAGGGAAYVSALFQTTFGTTGTAGTTTTRPPVDNISGVHLSSFASTTTGVSGINVGQTIQAGVFLSLRSELNAFELQRGDTTNFNARAIVAATTVPNVPVLDVELNGILQITQETVQTGAARTLKGHIDNAQLSTLGQAFSNPGPRKTVLVDLDITVTVTGGTAIEINISDQLKLSADWGKQPLEVNAQIILGSAAARTLTVATAALKENADVLAAGNVRHQQALAALDIVAAALRDVTFAAAKARLLFPPPPPVQDDITVRGTLDWVLFHRRRTKQCSLVVEVPPVQPRSYRVFEVTVPSQEAAQAMAKTLDDPASLAALIKSASANPPDLVLKFAGDSAQPLFDFTAADSEWKLFQPGKTIAFVFFGSKGDDDQALQTSRVRQFESAILDDSKEDPNTVLKPLVPFPAQATPPDADGIMLFITYTIPSQTTRTALVVFSLAGSISSVPAGTHIPAQGSTQTKVTFIDNVPQGTALADSFKGLPPGFSIGRVTGVTLAVVVAPVDAGAQSRLNAVVTALMSAGGITPQTNLMVLSQPDKDQLASHSVSIAGIDEVIYLELPG